MSFFDQPYYALTKAHMSHIGMWPEQSKYVRIIRRLILVVLATTIVAPRVTRFGDIWEDTDALIHDMPIFLTGAANVAGTSRFIQHFDEIQLSFENMEKHWEILKNTLAVVILHKYAERGRCIVAVYSMSMYIGMLFYWSLCLSPIILDIIDPLNETRSKTHIFQTTYGIDNDKYYWLILAYEYIVTMVGVTIVVAAETMYFTWAVHACALFEVVSFAELVETICSAPLAVGLVAVSIMMVFTGVNALINIQHRSILMQSAAYFIGQVFNLYIMSIPGQELMNHSEQIHTTAYDLEWTNMPVKAQKLLIPIMIRSNKPCRFAARKVYVLSMESFGSTIRTVMSYFTIFAQMI